MRVDLRLGEGFSAATYVPLGASRRRLTRNVRRNAVREIALSASNSSPSVLVATREPATRAGIRVASDADGIEVVGEVASVCELLDAVDRSSPDICLIDVELPGGGIRGAAEVLGRAPGVAVVMLAEEADAVDANDARALGRG